MQLVLNILAHLLTPGLRTENTGLQFNLILKPAFTDGFTQISGVGRGTAQNGGAQIAHELDLAVGVSGRHWQRQGAHLM